MHNDVKPTRSSRICRLLLGMALLATPSLYAQSAPPRDVDVIRKKACADIQAEYNRVAAKYRNQAALKGFEQQLSAATQLASAVLRDIAAHKAAYLDQSLSLISSEKGDKESAKPVGAMKILADHQQAFGAEPISLDSLGQDAAILQSYRSTYLGALKDTIAARTQNVVRADIAQEMMRLYLLLPMLDRADSQWTASDLDALPTWLKRPEYIPTAERFAIQAQRPRMAFLLSRIALKAGDKQVKEDPATYVNYLQRAADMMFRDREYAAGRQCLQTALVAANSANLTSISTDLRLRLAEVTADMGQHDKAADQLKSLLASTTSDPIYAKAAMLRLKYLYEVQGKAKQADYKSVLAEATAFRQDTRCRPYLPQILYIGWVTCRRENSTSNTESSWREEFLQKCPDNPLGADMYFATAMSALASSNYDQAKRILKFIEYRYPESRLLPKVQEISKRLDSTTSTTSSKTTQPPTTRPAT